MDDFLPGDVRPYKFVSHEISPVENYKDVKVYQLLVKANRGTLSKEEKDDLIKMIYDHGEKHSIRLMGWKYNFSPFLRRFYTKTQHYGVQEIFAFNKMQIRKYLTCFMGHIYDICETKK